VEGRAARIQPEVSRLGQQSDRLVPINPILARQRPLAPAVIHQQAHVHASRRRLARDLDELVRRIDGEGGDAGARCPTDKAGRFDRIARKQRRTAANRLDQVQLAVGGDLESAAFFGHDLKSAGVWIGFDRVIDPGTRESSPELPQVLAQPRRIDQEKGRRQRVAALDQSGCRGRHRRGLAVLEGDPVHAITSG